MEHSMYNGEELLELNPKELSLYVGSLLEAGWKYDKRFRVRRWIIFKPVINRFRRKISNKA